MRVPAVAVAEPPSRLSSWTLFGLALVALSACSASESGVDGGSNADALAAGSAEVMPVPRRANPGALAEILAHAPSSQPQATGPDGGTLVGTPTEFDGGAPEPEPPKKKQLRTGKLFVQPLLSSPAIERAAREQIYWTLHEQCRGPDGAPPPPDAITLRFTIRHDGSVDPASVSAHANDAQFVDVAECVLREFSALPFRGPAAGRDNTARVIVTWPSVD